MIQKRLSGLQQEVLALYRSILRAAAKKDRQSSQSQSFSNLLTSGQSTLYARNEFRRDAESVKRSDFRLIEYKLRKGAKYVKLMTMEGVKVVGGSV